MPAWVKKSIVKVVKSVTNPAVVLVETDPSLIHEFAAADEQRDYLSVETNGANVTAKVYRWEGARSDLLRRLDASGAPHLTLTGAAALGVHEVSWPVPGGAARKVTIEITVTAGTESITLEMDNVYRTKG